MLFTNSILALAALSSLSSTEAYRILALFPMPAKSHSILGHGVVRHLLEAGHEVVHVTCYPRNESKERLKEIGLSKLEAQFSKMKDEMEHFKIKNIVDKEISPNIILLSLMTQNIYSVLFETEAFLNLLRNPTEKFDAVITEWFFYNGVAGIASVLECPLIWLGTTETHWNVLKMIDEIPNPAYTTDMSSSNQTPLSLWGRTYELFNIIWKSFALSFIVAVKEKPFFNKVFSDIAEKRSVPVPTYEDVVYNASMLLINSHPSFGTPFKLPQNAKYIGGYHVETTVKPLPKDLKKILDEAKNGAIYFSLGSNFKSAEMSAEMKRSLFDMFGKLKETVIWKFETNIENVPANVHLVKWAPQESILAHPNLRTFITHGGQLSTTEAIHHGVPVIGIPLGADQHINMNSVAKRGFGIKIRLSKDLARQLNDAIHTMLRDSSYAEKAKALAQIYHDRSAPPGKELVYWVEHVIRTRGAVHLRSPALMVPWYQKLYLDLLALISLTVVVTFFLVKRMKKAFSNTCVQKSKKHQ